MNKEELKAKASQKIDEVSAKINELKAKKASVEGEAKQKYEESLSELNDRKADLESSFDQIKNSAEEQLAEAKTDFEKASHALESGMKKIANIV